MKASHFIVVTNGESERVKRRPAGQETANAAEILRIKETKGFMGRSLCELSDMVTQQFITLDAAV